MVESTKIEVFWCQFHQHFTRAFFVKKICTQLFCTYILRLIFLAKEFWRKCTDKMLAKLTTGCEEIIDGFLFFVVAVKSLQ
jgi:hypothetical protein